MNSKKIFLSLGAIVVPTGSVIASVSFASNQVNNKGYKYIYNGQVFNSLEEIKKFFLMNKIVQTGEEKVIGSLASSYSNYDKGMLNKALLPSYDPSKISLAWEKADGSLTPDYEAALKTLYNPGLTVYKYDDGFGNLFESPDLASSSRRSKSKEILTSEVMVPDFSKNPNIDEMKINPFAKEDWDNFENNLKSKKANIIENFAKTGSIIGDIGVKGKYSFSDGDNKSTELIKDVVNKFNNDLIDKVKNTNFDSYITDKWEQNNIKLHGYDGGRPWDSHGESTYGLWNFDPPSYDDYNTYWKWSTEPSNTYKYYNNYKSMNESQSLIGLFKKYVDVDTLTTERTGVDYSNSNFRNLKNNSYENFDSRYISRKHNELKDKVKDKIEKIYTDPSKEIGEWLDANYPILIQMQKELRNILIAKLVDKLVQKKNTIKNLVSSVSRSSSKMQLYFRDSEMNYKNFDRGRDKHSLFDSYYYTQAMGSFRFDMNYKLEKSEINFLSDENEIKSNWSLNANDISSEIGKSFNLDILDFVKKINEMKNNSDTSAPKYLTMYKDGSPYLKLEIHKNTNKDIFEIVKVDIADSLMAKLEVKYDKGNDKLQKLFNKKIKDINIDPTTFVKINPVSTTIGIENDLEIFQNKNLLKNNLENIIARYAHNLYAMNNGTSDKKIKDKIEKQKLKDWQTLKRSLLLGYDFKNNNLKVKMGKFYASGVSLFNTSFIKGALAAEGAIAYTEDDFDKQKDIINNLPVAQKVIPYNLNGEKVETGSWSFDNEVLIKYNALNMMAPKKNKKYIFINGLAKPIENNVFYVHKITIENKDIYFDSFTSLEKYLLEYIKSNVERKEF